MGQTSIINRARLSLAKAIAPRTGIPSNRDVWGYGNGTYSGYRLSWARRQQELRLDPYGVALAAETSVWAKACVDLRSSAVSRMPWTITDASGNKLENTPFHNMIRYARLAYQQNLFALWETSLSVHGETYFEKLNNADVPGFMIPGGLRLLNAIAMTPQISQGQVIYYQYIANGGKATFKPDELFIHRYNSLTDDFRATSPMITAMDAIGIKRSMQSFMRGHYDNDATPGGIVSPKAGVTANEGWVNRVMQMWADTFKGSNNANSVGFIPAEIDYKQFDRKMPAHQQALSDDQINEICTAFRVPVDMVRTAANKDPLGGGGKMDSARAMFYEDFVEPECENIDTFINDIVLPWLMPNSGSVFAFDYDETRSLISDTKERSDKVRAEFAEGAITFNEMRIALDYDPIPGGDWYQFTPGKVIVMASQIANAPALMAAAAPKPPEPPAPPPLPVPPVQPQLPPTVAPAEPTKDVMPTVGKSAAVMLSLANHPDLVVLQNLTRKYVGDTPMDWNAPESFHVTVLTAPIVNDEQVSQLKSALDEIPVPELSLKVGSLGAFHTLGEHAVHFKIRSNQALNDYQETVYQKCVELGIPVSGYSLPDEYKPHVTMGYAADKVSPQSFYSGLAIKPTELHLGVGDDIVYKKPVGNVITQVVEPIKSYHDAALDELGQWEKKVKNKGVKAVFVNYLIRDEIADTLRAALATDGAEIKAAFAVARDQIAQKAIQATRLDFENEFDDLLAKALTNEADRRTWAASLRYLLNKYGKLAFADGLTDGGLDSGEMDDEDKDTLAAHLAEQSQYVTGLGEAIYKQDAVDDQLAQQKAAMWFNKSINPLYQAGLLSADKNGLYEWVYGDTEHCADCKTMNGQRHRLKDYARKGIQPKADSLACKGFNCACSYVRVSGKARGNWLGSGKTHEHTEAA